MFKNFFAVISVLVMAGMAFSNGAYAQTAKILDSENLTITSTTLLNFPTKDAKLSVKTNQNAECAYSPDEDFADVRVFEKKTENLDGSWSHSSGILAEEGRQKYKAVCFFKSQIAELSVEFAVGKEAVSPVQKPEEGTKAGISNGNFSNVSFIVALAVLIFAFNVVFLAKKMHEAAKNRAFSIKGLDSAKEWKAAGRQIKKAYSNNSAARGIRRIWEVPVRKRLLRPLKKTAKEIKEEFVPLEAYFSELKKKSKEAAIERLRSLAGKNSKYARRK